jgi:activator of 2-hydroxyglutaryl-CoA dehydratase
MTSALNQQLFLGIDLGSVSLAYVLLDQDRNIVQHNYIFHRGNIFSALEQQLKQIDLTKVS